MITTMSRVAHGVGPDATWKEENDGQLIPHLRGMLKA
jgi:hypothetical protein